MKIYNSIFDPNRFHENSYLICSVGYEDRSFFILNKLKNKLENRYMAFSFTEFTKSTNKPDRISEEKLKHENTIDISYDDIEVFFDKIKALIIELKKKHDKLELHIDYSYMPRQWYCKLPSFLSELLSKKDAVFFWYSEGIYPKDFKEYPTAGIDSFLYFSGNPSLRTNRKRTHLLSLSYDIIRTEGIISILDPENFISCCAYDSESTSIKQNVSKINQSIISRAKMCVYTHLDDFQLMLSKLCEIVNDFWQLGDVIIIPDGPKPLIFAMSLIPTLLNKHGIICMQVTRTNRNTTPINVKPNGKVIGFSIIYP
ncbi:MAG: hypothetical protein ACI4SF_13065 [Oscillospiraceae bacterium]